MKTLRLMLALAALALPQTALAGKTEVVLASIQAPGFDAAGLGRLFDAARRGMWAVPAFHRQSIKPRSAANPIRLSSPALMMPSRPLVVPSPKETPSYRRTFQRLLARPQATDRYDELIMKAAQAYHLDARLLKAVIAAESEFFIGAISPKGARGLMQVMPLTAEEMGVPRSRLHEPASNITAGAAYIAYLFKVAWKRFKLKGVRYHDAPLWLKQRIIAAYNAGPRFLFRDRGWYTQTKHYVRKVILFYHSRVTDFRRVRAEPGPSVSVTASSGTLY
jgi:soluble lytic murein transglycosylase-like protein